MGKLLNLLLFVLAIDFALILFMGAYTPTNTLFLLITDGIDWGDLSLISTITILLALAGTVGVFIGTFWKAAPDYLLFASITGIFFSYGISIFELYNRLTSYAIFDANNYLIALMIVPLATAYVYVILKFWRGND